MDTPEVRDIIVGNLEMDLKDADCKVEDIVMFENPTDKNQCGFYITIDNLRYSVTIKRR